jgi:GNAT superfamily N-acetyltransferase
MTRDNSVSIRLARPEDGNSVYQMMAELGYASLERGRFDRAFQTVLDRSDVWVLVAEDVQSRRMLGLASMSERPQLRLAGILVTIDEFVIREDARGRGVGKALLEEAKRRARALGARRLQLDTNRGRESYRRGFYVKNDFIEADSAVMRMELEKGDE